MQTILLFNVAVKLIMDGCTLYSCYNAAGAMRIPGTGKIGGDSKHFLTDFYGQDRFQLPVQNFQNQIEKGFYFYGGVKYKVEGKLFNRMIMHATHPYS